MVNKHSPHLHKTVMQKSNLIRQFTHAAQTHQAENSLITVVESVYSTSMQCTHLDCGSNLYFPATKSISEVSPQLKSIQSHITLVLLVQTFTAYPQDMPASFSYVAGQFNMFQYVCT